jgi:hypothetical protein
MVKTIYDKTILDTDITINNATLIGNYEKLTRDTLINFKCNCGQEANKTFRSIHKVGAVCKKCTSIGQQDKKKKTELKRYGVDNVMKLDKFKDKLKQTNLKKYGCSHPLKNKEVINKLQNTVLEKYGVKHVLQLNEIKEKMKSTMLDRHGVEYNSQLSEIKEKIKEKMILRYNVPYGLQAREVREKIKKTCLEKYGVEHVSQTPEFKEKVKQTFINNYGVDNPNKTPEIKEKIRKTNLERYGVENPLQNKEVQERNQKNSKKYKEYIMPSGEVRKVQGYEPFALNELLKTNSETDIVTNRKDVPRITYNICDKTRYYFPDIYIPSENKIIEVKSTWTYKCKEDNIQEKKKATEEAGYVYETWVYDSKGNKIEIIQS